MPQCIQIKDGKRITRKTNFFRITRAGSYGVKRSYMRTYVTSVDVCDYPGNSGGCIAFFNTLYDGVFIEKWASEAVLRDCMKRRGIAVNQGGELTADNMAYLFG